MADDGGQVVVGDDPPATTAPNIIGQDGMFTEKWRESLPEGLREEKCLETIKSFENMARGYVSAQKLVGADKVVLPGDKSTDAEWGEFYKATGRPDTGDEYQMVVPDEYKQYFTDERMAEARAIMHTIGLSRKQADALWAYEQKRVSDGLAENEAAKIEAKKAAEDTLRTRWGLSYDERLRLANRMIADNTADEEAQQKLLALVGNYPEVADLLATLGRKFTEAKVIPGDGPVTPTPTEAKAKAQELTMTEGYLGGQLKKTDPAKHNRITREISELHEQAHPDTVDTAQGRR